MNKKITIKGKVISGSGRGKHFVNLPWVKKQINTKLGFNPYLGTLNLRLSNERDTIGLRNAKGIIIKPEIGYYEGKCFRALVMKKIEGSVVLPIVPDYPSDLLEIIAPTNLRKALGLTDGMTVKVTIRLE